jgi:hypothetical protein
VLYWDGGGLPQGRRGFDPSTPSLFRFSSFMRPSSPIAHTHRFPFFFFVTKLKQLDIVGVLRRFSHADRIAFILSLRYMPVIMICRPDVDSQGQTGFRKVSKVGTLAAAGETKHTHSL